MPLHLPKHFCNPHHPSPTCVSVWRHQLVPHQGCILYLGYNHHEEQLPCV
jgi:hypothetical protein